VIVGIVRSTLLARWLPVRVFGIYSLAFSIVSLSAVVAGFGMVGAFLHRAPETENEEQAAAVYFTLQLIFASVWTVLLLAGTFMFTSGPDRTALVIITLTQGGILVTNIPRAILVRRVVHRRLAFLQISDIVLSAGVALYLAWRGIGLWALLATNVITLAINVFFLYVWRPVWRPRLAWAPQIARYFLRFGSRNTVASALLQALNHVDDLWTGSYLGKTQLGYYSRAYTFATYPRVILASSINKVAGGTYAELKENRRRLSQAFFRANAFLVRGGFFLAGILALIAPEFIHLVIGDKWLPMLQAFRLMLVFTMLDPIKVTVADLFVAVGRPEQVVQARIVQLVALVAGLFLLGPYFGISGVALAVDLMLVIGIAILLWQARNYVDISLVRLFAVPTLALALGLALGYGAVELSGLGEPSWWTGMIKALTFSMVYGLISLALERHQVAEALSILSNYFIQPARQVLGTLSHGDE
jgi:O-antigen/teichoic acid export membrane protein